MIPEGGYVFAGNGGEYELETLATTAQAAAGCDELSVTIALSAASTAGGITLRLSTDDAPDIIKAFSIGDVNHVTAIELQGNYPGLAPGPHLFRVFAKFLGPYTVIPTGYLQVQSP